MPRRKIIKRLTSDKLFNALMERKLLSTTCDNCPYKKTCPFYKDGSTCVILKDLIGVMEGLELDRIRDDPERLIEIVGAIIQSKLVELNLLRMQQSSMGVQSSKTIREEEKLLIQWIRLAMDLLKAMGVVSEKKQVDTRILMMGLFKRSIEGMTEESPRVIDLGDKSGG